MTNEKSPKIPKIFLCDSCDYTTSNRKDFDKHKMTLKHKIRTNTNEKSPKIPKIFLCDSCYYTTSNVKDFDKHKMTLKHKIRTKNPQKSPKIPKAYFCDCGKSYKHSSSLWNHKQKCGQSQDILAENVLMVRTDETDYKSLFVNAVKEMKDQQNTFISELQKKDIILLSKDNSQFSQRKSNFTSENQIKLNE